VTNAREWQDFAEWSQIAFVLAGGFGDFCIECWTRCVIGWQSPHPNIPISEIAQK
jgi:hypothetical protein